MKKILNFFKEELSFIFVFISYSLCIYTYFLVSKDNFSIAYCVILSVFFFVVYLIIELISYLGFSSILRRLRNTSIEDKSFSPLKNQIINTVDSLHNEYNKKINELELKSNENKRFISAWIHNLKTPITVNDLIIQRTLNNEIEPLLALEDIKKENEKLITMLNNILELERLDEFAKDFYPQKINLKEEVTKIINDNKRLFIASNVFPKLEAQDDIIVLSDYKWNKVLINQIISNAVKYSNGSNKILIKIENYDTNVVLSITDYGIGIPEYDLSKIYEPFFTGENGRDNVNSSGIGLYLCKEICKHLNHQIDIVSRVGEYTTVKITYLTKM